MIDFEKLYGQGYRGVLFDVDNTLVPHGAPADDRAIALFAELHRLGFSCMLLSNNKKSRVKSFCEQVKYAGYIHRAGKPMPGNYRKAMKQMKTTPENTIFIGDQIFTDIIGANFAKIRTILVKPIRQKEEIQIVLKRIPERLVLYFYRRYCKRRKAQYPSSAK